MSTTLPPAGRALDVARSVLRAALGDRVRTAGPDRLEALAADNTPLVQQSNVEPVGGVLRVADVEPPAVAHFEGFLDGIQRSATVAYLDGVPLLHGTAAAAIRERDFEGRMATWLRPSVDHAVYASRALLGEAAWEQVGGILDTRGHLLRDTDNDLPVPSRHPSALLRQGLDALSRVRNDLERDMGHAWCHADAARPLYVDGSLRSSRTLLRSTGAVGVVKSHATLYLPDEALPLVTALGAGQRTTCIMAFGGDGNPHFLTWYLRLRSAAAHDPFYGLIRVETGARELTPVEAEAHADTVSRWLLAERAPLARPDARWDVMPYAIRDCEVYLRAVA